MKIQIEHKLTGAVLFEGEYGSIKIAVEAAVAAKVSLRYAFLRGANLHLASLYGADLRYADLRYADLRCANLRYADLRYADLRSADLRYADLRSANLNDTDLSGSNLDFTNIPMWCGALKGVKVDIRLIRQMLLHIFALKCEDKTFNTIKRLIRPFAELSDKWEYYKS